MTDPLGRQRAGGVVEQGPGARGVRIPLLDRLAPGADALELEEALTGVEVGPGTHLDPTAPTVSVLAVRREGGGVEVDRLVAEHPPTVDLEGGQLIGRPLEHDREHAQRHDVLAVDPGLQLGSGEDVIQGHRGQPVHGIGHGAPLHGAPLHRHGRQRLSGESDGLARW